MESREFDDIIKNKLDQPIKLEDQRAWDLFMLSAIDKGEEDLFEDRSTDNMVRNALENHKVDYDAKSWDHLLDKIKQEDSEPVMATKFDKEISNSLKSLKRKYDAGSWPRLAARIEAEERYLRDYYRAKIVEGVLFLLLIVTLFQFTLSDKFNESEIKHDVLAILHPADMIVNENVASTSSSLEHSKTQLSNAFPSKLNVLPSKSALNNRIDHVSNSIAQFTGFNLNNNSQAHQINSRSPLGQVSLIKDVNISPLIVDDKNQLNDKVAQLYISSQTLYRNVAVQSLISFTPELTDEWAVLSIPDLIKKNVEGEWRVGMYARTDYNEIKLPEQAVYLQARSSTSYLAKTVHSFGYGAGFKANYTKNHLGFETGLGYATRSYTPDRLYRLPDNPYNAKFAKIEYNLIEFPLSIRYGSKGNNRLATYIQAGVNTNIITQAIYDVKAEYKYLSAIGSSSTTKEVAYTLSTLKDEFTKFDKRRVLIYAQGSAGLEWKANQNQTIYSQITFGQRFLSQQFGPNFDQAKSLSLELGLRTRI